MKEFNLLSLEQKRVRSLYLSLRSGLDGQLIEDVLLGSYQDFKEAGEKYPFSQKNEMRPATQFKEKEYGLFREALVMFLEGSIPPEYKNHLRVRSHTAYNVENMQRRLTDIVLRDFEMGDRSLTSAKFPNLLAESNGFDGALVLQRDSSTTSKTRFILSDATVKIDYPITDAAQELMKHLRYIYRHIFELDANDDSSKMPTSEKFEGMFYKYHGIHPKCGGTRRIAAAVASQLLRMQEFMSTVYVSSQEERTLTRMCGSELDKFMLVHIPNSEVKNIEEANRKRGIDLTEYAVDETKKGKVLIYQISYGLTATSTPPQKKKRREPNTRTFLRRVKHGLILPCPKDKGLEPIVANSLYRGKNGLL